MAQPVSATSSWGKVLRVFLRLGITSFGGPVAHLGYFRTEFVKHRKWLFLIGLVSVRVQAPTRPLERVSPPLWALASFS